MITKIKKYKKKYQDQRILSSLICVIQAHFKKDSAMLNFHFEKKKKEKAQGPHC